jgi:hypothetical protein
LYLVLILFGNQRSPSVGWLKLSIFYN